MIKKLRALLVGAVCLMAASASAQQRNCGSYDHLIQQLADNPSMAIERQNI
jgi:hypothetical protein